MKDARGTAEASPWKLFKVFFSISAVTIGGGYAMVPVIGRALEKRGWFSEKDFLDLFSRAQAFPGPLALTTALLAGRVLAGPAGAAAAACGVVLPPFGALIAVGALLGRLGQHPFVAAFLEGAGATVPGLVAALIYKLAKNRAWNLGRALGAAALSLALILAPGLALPIFLAGISIMYILERSWSS